MSRARYLAESLTKADVLRMGTPPMIRWYKTERPSCNEDNDCPDAELIGEGTVHFNLHDWDKEEGDTEVSLVIKYLTTNGATTASSSHFHPGIWYTATGEPNVRTGAILEWSYHLHGFDEDQEEEIYKGVA